MVNTCNKDKVDFWKNKLKSANSLKNKYKRQCRHFALRCVTLKAKISELKAENKALKAENKLLQKQLAAVSEIRVDTTTAAGHQFPLLLVLFCVHCQKYGTMSLRSTRNCVLQMSLVFGLKFKAPSHTSIRNWVCKCGYHRVFTGAGLPNVVGNKWVLWVDESIMMGAQKMLLIIGRPIEDWTFETAPTIATVYVLGLKLATEWKAEAVLVEIQLVAQNRTIVYIVSDRGHNLVKSYELGGFLHIPDLTHAAAKALERIYSKLETFKAFTSACGLLRKKWNLSLGKCAYMPPSQRSKVRFANIFPLIEWSAQALQLMATAPETMPEAVVESFAFLGENRAMLSELLGLIRAIKTISHTLKHKGFSVETAASVTLILEALPATEHTQKFVKEMQEWLTTVENIRQKTGEKTVFCCSDVIESIFGKFKNKVNINSSFGMTEFVFTIANFGADFTKEEICTALEEIKLHLLTKAKPEKKSIAHQKRDIFRNTK